jgi:hypothetical protein
MTFINGINKLNLPKKYLFPLITHKEHHHQQIFQLIQ